MSFPYLPYIVVIRRFGAVAESTTLKLALIAILESYTTGHCDVAVAVTLPLYEYSLLRSLKGR